jgi:hypothetical protein
LPLAIFLLFVTVTSRDKGVQCFLKTILSELALFINYQV